MPNKLSPDSQRVSIVLPKSLVAKLDNIAKAEDRSRSNVMHRMIKEELQHIQQIQESKASYPKANERKAG